MPPKTRKAGFIRELVGYYYYTPLPISCQPQAIAEAGHAKNRLLTLILFTSAADSMSDAGDKEYGRQAAAPGIGTAVEKLSNTERKAAWAGARVWW